MECLWYSFIEVSSMLSCKVSLKAVFGIFYFIFEIFNMSLLSSSIDWNFFLSHLFKYHLTTRDTVSYWSNFCVTIVNSSKTSITVLLSKWFSGWLLCWSDWRQQITDLDTFACSSNANVFQPTMCHTFDVMDKIYETVQDLE